jgi:hypothetical protein
LLQFSAAPPQTPEAPNSVSYGEEGPVAERTVAPFELECFAVERWTRSCEPSGVCGGCGLSWWRRT